MLPEEIDRLSQTYDKSLDNSEFERLFDYFDINIGDILILREVISNDLSEDDYGISWWKQFKDLTTQSRILISDYLISSIESVFTNIVEAKYSILEIEHAVSNIRNWAERQSHNNFEMRNISPLEDLNIYKFSCSLAGFFRSLGSSLDCISSCITGIAGLPIDIKSTSFNKVLNDLKNPRPASEYLFQLNESISSALLDSGPKGWVEWTLQMRNMLVHRGRSLPIAQFIKDDTGIDVRIFLPKNPQMSDIESAIISQSFIETQITTNAIKLTTSLFDSLIKFANCTCSLLANFWGERKLNVNMIKQPRKQWNQPNGLITPPPFKGYSNLNETLTPITDIRVDQSIIKRLRSAGFIKKGNNWIPNPSIWS
jgi:hypothetical protein